MKIAFCIPNCLPFNKLEIKMIQNKQGVLSNSVNVDQQGSLKVRCIEASGFGHFTCLQHDDVGNKANKI